MRSGLVLLLLLLGNSITYASIAHVQTVNAQAAGVTSLTSASITTTTGDLMVMATGVDRIDSAPTASDNKSNTWTGNPSNNVSFGSGSALTLQFYSVLTTGGASHTFTVTSSNFSQDTTLFVSEFSGTASASVLDQNTGQANTFVTSITTGATGTRTTANEVLVAHFFNNLQPETTISAGTNFTIPTNGSIVTATGPPGAVEYWIVSATGTDAGTFTQSPSAADAGAIIGTYKAASGVAAAAGFNKRRKLTQLGLP